MKTMIKVVIENLSTHPATIPYDSDFQQWCDACGSHVDQVSIRLVDEGESRQLNYKCRKKNKPTNVLSFMESSIPGFPAEQLGTLVMCPAIIIYEAQQANIDERSHWAHICVHGMLHLLGHDHENDDDAILMESIEVRILNQLGFSNPYH